MDEPFSTGASCSRRKYGEPHDCRARFWISVRDVGSRRRRAAPQAVSGW
jgi:hypothetical protein